MFSKEQLYYNNRPMNRGLFRDVVVSDYNIMTLEPRQGSDLPVLRDIYLSYCKEDPTEYNLAVEVFGSWDYWKQLTSSVEIAPYIASWREEIVMYFKSKAVKAIAKEAEGGKNKFQSAKWLYEAGFIDKPPKKDTPAKQKEDPITKVIKNDFARLKKDKEHGNPSYDQ